MYGNCGGFGRRYLTKDEKSSMLQQYATDLENELKGVRERLKELKKE
jgi:hypothetical protein